MNENTPVHDECAGFWSGGWHGGRSGWKPGPPLGESLDWRRPTCRWNYGGVEAASEAELAYREWIEGGAEWPQILRPRKPKGCGGGPKELQKLENRPYPGRAPLVVFVKPVRPSVPVAGRSSAKNRRCVCSGSGNGVATCAAHFAAHAHSPSISI
jgi:hypothetical protein